MTKTQLSKLLKDFRMKRGWTQQQAALVLGISLRSFVIFERGYIHKPRAITIIRIKNGIEAQEKAA